MGIRRHTASQDTTITDAFKLDGVTRATSSNMGRADSLEVFYLSESEGPQKSRALVQFDLNEIKNDQRPNPDYYLRLFNVPHHETTPYEFDVGVRAISQSWNEGYGQDLDTYKDEGYTSGSETELGATWKYARSGSQWNTGGGDFYSDRIYSDYLPEAESDIYLNITGLVDDWKSGSKDNNGVAVKVTASQETGSRSYFTKKFSARSTQYFFNRPIIEERWDSTVHNDRHSFYPSSSAAPSDENLNTIHFYNYHRGQLHPVQGDASNQLYVKLYESSDYSTEITSAKPNYPITASIDYFDRGRYDAEFALDSTASAVYDEWYSGSEVYHQDKIHLDQTASQRAIQRKPEDFVMTIPNLHSEYSVDDKPTLRLVTRRKNRRPTMYSTHTNTPQIDTIRNLYYKVERTADGETVIDYGTGSKKHTKLSYDASGSYFTLNMKNLESDLGYKLKFMREIDNNYIEFDKDFKFRVSEDR